MPLVVTGATCASLIYSPPNVAVSSYYRWQTKTSNQMLGIQGGSPVISDFTYAFPGISSKPLACFKLKMLWSSTLTAPNVSPATQPTVASGNAPLLSGDFRLRALYSENDYPNGAVPTDLTFGSSANKTVIIFLPDPDDTECFILYNPTMSAFPTGTTTISATGYLRKDPPTTVKFLKTLTAAIVPAGTTIRPMFLVDILAGTNNKRNYLDSTGKPYDVNQPLANISKIRAWNFEVQFVTEASPSTVQTGYRIAIQGLPNGITMTNTNLDTQNTNVLYTANSGSTYSVTLQYNDSTGTTQSTTYMPIETLTADAEIINSGDNEYKIFYQISPLPSGAPVSGSVMGWTDVGPTLKYYNSYFSVLSAGSTNGLKLGFFNLLPLSSETTSTALRYFMLLTSTNSHYLTAAAGGLSWTSAPANITSISTARSTQSGTSTYLNNLFNYGGWSFENITAMSTPASSTGSDSFYLMYTPPYSTTGVLTSTVAGTAASTVVEQAAGTKFYLTWTSASQYGCASPTVAGSPATGAAKFQCAECSLNSDGVCTTTALP